MAPSVFDEVSEEEKKADKEHTKEHGDFNITPRDIVAFEAGIKLGALYHQFIGTPLNSETVSRLEQTIERSVKLQPFVKDVYVRIDRNKLRARKNRFGYCELQGDMIDVQIRVSYNDIEAYACLQYNENMKYPLMFLQKIVVKK
ncbi:MAG: dihydroneopterin aldolase family protein [Canidatus Methanoxibalbensis ujae]|nr:dihydroneopterin aldolase family protein [Candidatus Methanoxibalbensis ujae]